MGGVRGREETVYYLREENRGEAMTYRVILEHRGGGVEALGEFETRKGAMVCINQYRIDDEGHDDYWRVWIEDAGRIIYTHASTHYIIDKLSEAERRSGRILTGS